MAAMGLALIPVTVIKLFFYLTKKHFKGLKVELLRKILHAVSKISVSN